MSKRERVPRCVVCRRPIPLERRASDSPVHSLECANILLSRILVAVPGVIDLLPSQWRADINTKFELPADHNLVRSSHTVLIAETNRRFWAQTNYKVGTHLDPNNASDQRMMSIWMDVFRKVQTEADEGRLTLTVGIDPMTAKHEVVEP